jgi:putative copper export protein
MLVGVWFWKRTQMVEALSEALSPTWNLAAGTANVFLQASAALVVLSSVMLARQSGATSLEVTLKVLTSGSVFPWLVALFVGILATRIRPVGLAAALAVAYAAASSSHAVEQRLSFFSVSFATMHLVALFVWVGPLLALAWLRSAQSGLRAHPGLMLLLRDGLERFSLWAGTAVALIVISGVRQTILIADGWPSGQWGFWFWTKMILAAFSVVPFAVFHHLALRRANSGDGAMPVMRQTVWLETAGVVTVMLCAAVMAGMNP